MGDGPAAVTVTLVGTATGAALTVVLAVVAPAGTVSTEGGNRDNPCSYGQTALPYFVDSPSAAAVGPNRQPEPDSGEDGDDWKSSNESADVSAVIMAGRQERRFVWIFKAPAHPQLAKAFSQFWTR